MRWSWTPGRRHDIEILDNPRTDADTRHRAMADVTRANRLFGGTRSMLRALREDFRRLPRRAVLLDVGTGLADIAAHATRAAQRDGITLTPIGVDASESLLRTARRHLAAAIVADARHLPFADACVDVAACSQLLHHFSESEARVVIAELHRVASRSVVISDLRRSWLAAAGFWLASIALRFHPVTRHDGVLSVLRGFTAAELSSLVVDVTGSLPRVRRTLFWRISASWSKHPPSDGSR
jgi:SAM-dependent methyltransferase